MPARTRRRELLRLAGGVFATSLLVNGATTRTANARSTRGASSDSWTSSAGGPSGARFLAGDLGPLQERWRIVMKGGVPGTPAIVGERVYAASLGGDIVAVERSTGITLWHQYVAPTSYGDRALAFFAGPAVEGDRVVVAGGVVACLDARTGSTLWTHPATVSDSLDYFWGAPIVSNGLAIVGSGSGTEAAPARGRLRAYALEDGVERWHTDLVPLPGNGGAVLAPPTVDIAAGLLFVATGAPYEPIAGEHPGTSTFFALDVLSGNVVWKDQISRQQNFNSAAVLLDQRAFAANKTGFYCWDLVSREQAWVTQLTPVPEDDTIRLGPTVGPEGGPLATDGQRLYAISNDMDARQFVVAALSPDDGSVLWEQRFAGFSFSAPAIASDVLVVAAGDGSLRLLDPASGEVQEEYSLGAGCACAPAIVSGTLVVGTGAEPFLRGQSLIGFAR